MFINIMLNNAFNSPRNVRPLFLILLILIRDVAWERDRVAIVGSCVMHRNLYNYTCMHVCMYASLHVCMYADNAYLCRKYLGICR